MEYRYPIFVISEINILRIAIIRDLTRNIDDYFLIPFYRSSISCWNNVSLIRPVHVDLQIISLANFSYCELPHKSSSIRILVYIFALRAQTFFSRTFFDSPRMVYRRNEETTFRIFEIVGFFVGEKAASMCDESGRKREDEKIRRHDRCWKNFSPPPLISLIGRRWLWRRPNPFKTAATGAQWSV